MMRKLLLRKSWGDLVWFLKIWKSQKDRGEAFMSTTPQKQLTPSYLCTRCGTCVAACPKGIIKVSEDNFPYIDNQDLCTDCDVCRNVCPGIEVDFEEICKGIFRQTLYDPYVGYYKNIYVGYAIDENIRKNASSGGIVTSLLISALEQGLIDAAIVVKMNQDQPLLPEVVVADTVEKIKESMQSKYQPVPLNAILRKAEKYERIAVVGTPCQIQGLRKWERVNPKIREKIIYHLGIFCGLGCMEKDATYFLLKKLNVKKENILSIEYRAREYPGGFLVKLKNGNEKYVSKENYKLLHLLYAPRRCILCRDFTNELSDISIGDAFSIKKGINGNSIVIVRSNRGKELLGISREQNYIFLEDIKIKKIIASQKLLFNFKKGGAAARIYMYDEMRPYYVSENTISNTSYKEHIKEKILITIYISRKIWIKLFELLPFSIFKFSSKIIKR
jgi:coenzyme F420 hydrogenase subunit beta